LAVYDKVAAIQSDKIIKNRSIKNISQQLKFGPFKPKLKFINEVIAWLLKIGHHLPWWRPKSNHWWTTNHQQINNTMCFKEAFKQIRSSGRKIERANKHQNLEVGLDNDEHLGTNHEPLRGSPRFLPVVPSHALQDSSEACLDPLS
jgi:hypothetical protein